MTTRQTIRKKRSSFEDIGTLVREVGEVHEQFPTWTLDNAFVHWFLQAFLVPDPETAARSVTGVSHDKGCDGVYLDESLAKVFVLQGKFHQGPKPPAEPRSDVIAFAQLARKMTGPKAEFDLYLTGIDPTVGKLLSEARQRIQRRAFELRLYYVSTGHCSAPLKSEAESEVAQANAVASLSVLDRADVLSLLTDYLGGAAPPVPYLDLPHWSSSFCPRLDLGTLGGGQGCAFAITGYNIVGESENVSNQIPDQTWKGRMIEEEVKRLMFDVGDVK